MHNIATIILPYRAYIHRATLALSILCALSVLLYGTFLLMAVAHAAKMSAARHTIAKLTSEVSVLEGNYLTNTKALTREKAIELGFVVPTHVVAVYAAPERPLSLNTR